MWKFWKLKKIYFGGAALKINWLHTKDWTATAIVLRQISAVLPFLENRRLSVLSVSKYFYNANISCIYTDDSSCLGCFTMSTGSHRMYTLKQTTHIQVTWTVYIDSVPFIVRCSLQVGWYCCGIATVDAVSSVELSHAPTRVKTTPCSYQMLGYNSTWRNFPESLNI